MLRTYVISDLTGEEIIGTPYEKNLKNRILSWKTNKIKVDQLYVQWKGYHNSFNSWTDKKDTVEMSEYFPEPKSLGGIVKAELDLSNYATKAV